MLDFGLHRAGRIASAIEQGTLLAGAILGDKSMQQVDGRRAKPTILSARLIVRET